MRVVFDTNIFISAFAIPKSQAEKAVLKIIEGEDVLFISKPVLDEILTVLASKFHRDREAISHTALYISSLATLVNPAKRLHILQDEPDNRIIECALCGKADAVVTGDKAMLKLKEYEGIRIMGLREYLET